MSLIRKSIRKYAQAWQLLASKERDNSIKIEIARNAPRMT